MDARFLYIVVVLFTTFDTQVLAQNNSTTAAPTTTGAPALNSTSTVAPTPTSTPAQSSSSTTPTPTTVSAATTTGTPATVTWTSIVSTIATTRATTTPAMSASVTSTPTPPFETRLEVILQVAGKCDDAITDNLSTAVGGVYSSKDYDYKNVTVQIKQTDEKCTVNITCLFGKKLTIGGIVEKFEKAVQLGKITIGKMKVRIQSIQVQVKGVTVGDYKPSDSDCIAKCCKGAGGPIEVNATSCDPAYKCVNYKLTKTVDDCLKVCNKDLCSAGTPLQVSLVILISGFFVNWLFKE